MHTFAKTIIQIIKPMIGQRLWKTVLNLTQYALLYFIEQFFFQFYVKILKMLINRYILYYSIVVIKPIFIFMINNNYNKNYILLVSS